MPDDRYTLCRQANGTWSVVDIFTNFPAIVEGRVMIGMDMEEADDMVDLLNTLDRERRSARRQ